MNEVSLHEAKLMIIVLIFTPAIWGVFGLVKFILWFVGLFVVPICILLDRKIIWLWDNDEKGFKRDDFPDRWSLYVDRCWRNAVGNSKYALEKVFGDPLDYIQRGSEIDESANKLQWRYRQTKLLNSIRIAKGDTEIYWGFKIGSSVPGFGFTLQSRPFFLAIPLVLFYGYAGYEIYKGLLA